MLIEEAFHAFVLADAGVSALAGTRGYSRVIPQDAALPAWAYQRVSTPERARSHSGPSGLACARFQVTCQAATYGAAKGLANAIRRACDGYAGYMGGSSTGVYVGVTQVEGDVDGFSTPAAPEVSAATVRLDVIVWHQES